MMKRITVLSTFLLGMLAVMAQDAGLGRRFKVNITPDGQSNMEAYLPENPSGRAVVDCPGGGYHHLSLQNEGHAWAEYFNKQGIAYFVLTYRMPQGNRELPFSDARAAIRMVRDSAQAWRINPRDVGIMGFSAGGHLASTVSTHAEWQERPDFSILFYPVISMDERETHKGSCVNFLGTAGQQDRNLVHEFSNQNAVHRHLTPPAVIFTANDDRTVPPVTNAIAYYSAMRRAGNDCALYVYPTGGHGFGMNPKFTYHEQMLSDLSTWLREHKAPLPASKKVACLGNSITDGHGIEMASQRGYPARLQRLLGDGYDVRNFGVSARTLLNKGDHPFMREQAWKDALGFEPDIVVVKLGTNDSKPENWKYGNEFEQDLRQMVTALQSLPSKPQIWLCTPIPAFGKTWNINDSVIQHAIIPLIEKVVKQERLSLIDLHTLFAGDGDKMQRDGIHPTEDGAQRMAELIADALKGGK